MLTSFHSPLRAVVIGASGGIGNAFVDALERNRGVGEILAFARRPERVRAKRATVSAIDIGDENSIAGAAASAAGPGPVDLVIVASGMLHDGERIQPEKAMRELDAAVMAEVFAINAIAPAIIGKHFLPILRKQHKSVFAALSARVGSIGDNRLGGWASYRASKAALNMLLRTLAIEHARRNRASLVVGLHPGTVDTGLSKPFQGRVPEAQLFTPETCVNHLLTVIDGLTPDDTGNVFAWDGQRIPS
jgi:NAD(P)-dependent dehydrogenase (short-subunit alcohol dehydrogenase family)